MSRLVLQELLEVDGELLHLEDKNVVLLPNGTQRKQEQMKQKASGRGDLARIYMHGKEQERLRDEKRRKKREVRRSHLMR